MNWQLELDELARREAMAREMGGADKVKRQHDGGRIPVRERVAEACDPDYFHEIGAIAGKAEYDGNNDLVQLVPSNCVFGRGKIDGRPVVICGDDFTVRGGSADATIKAKPQLAETHGERAAPAHHPRSRGLRRWRLRPHHRNHGPCQPARRPRHL